MAKKQMMTRVMENLSGILSRTHSDFQEMSKGKLPYGVAKATPKEQKEMFRDLTPEKLTQLLNQYGREPVNEWLGKMMEDSNA